jgi:pyruvate/2-oxoglutarate/acetoin dehydrogenase E1 component
MTTMKFRDALRIALEEEMEQDPSVFCVGEGIGERGGSYKVTEGLIARFGPGRVIDTPLSEAGFVGVGVGAAIAGQRPVVEILFIDFLLQAMDQVVNQAAKYRFMSGGEGRVPLVIRTQGGTGNSLAGQHSQSLEALLYHIPGLKVVMPATPRDAKGLLKASIRDDDPVIFIEHKQLYLSDGDVPDDPYEIPLGAAEIMRAGTDLTLVAWSHMATKALKAADELAADGISVEVINLRTLVPMDTACILDSVRRTGRLVIAQEAVRRGGVASDIAATVGEAAFDALRAPVLRVAGVNTVIPFNLGLEKATVPQVADIVAGVRQTLEATAPGRGARVEALSAG